MYECKTLCQKLGYDIVVVELWMNSWLFLVNDVLNHVVDELV